MMGWESDSLLPVVRPDVDGGKVDGRGQVVAREVLPCLLGPLPWVVAGSQGTPAPEALHAHREQVARVLLLHKAGHLLNPALHPVWAPWHLQVTLISTGYPYIAASMMQMPRLVMIDQQEYTAKRSMNDEHPDLR